MGLRFYRRLPLLPGVRLNLSGRGASMSFGHRGAWYTVGPHGRRTATLGWPGSGIRWTETTGGTGSRREPPAAVAPPSVVTPLPGVPPAPSALRGLVTVVVLVLIGVLIGRLTR